jgi:hypothetical protein
LLFIRKTNFLYPADLSGVFRIIQDSGLFRIISGFSGFRIIQDYFRIFRIQDYSGLFQDFSGFRIIQDYFRIFRIQDYSGLFQDFSGFRIIQDRKTHNTSLHTQQREMYDMNMHECEVRYPISNDALLVMTLMVTILLGWHAYILGYSPDDRD